MPVFDCRTVVVSSHAAMRMHERDISRTEVNHTLREGRVILSYPNDSPLPSFMLLAFPAGRPIHLLVGHDEAAHHCAMITVYEPDSSKWSQDFIHKLPRP